MWLFTFKMANCFGETCAVFLAISCFYSAFSKTLNDLEIFIEDKPEFCEAYATIGDTVAVDYAGMLQDGRVFDSTIHDRRQPIKFQLGAGTLIKGWEKGIQGMCVGEKRKLIIPPHLGYGDQGIEGVIPPASTLLFQVHLVGLERPSITNQAITFINFAVWPIGLFGIVYYLYKKISDAPKEDRKSEKRTKKRR